MLAAQLPGGRYGVLPVGKMPFNATLCVTELGHDVLVRGLETLTPVSIRAEFVSRWPAIAYLLPSRAGGSTILDGQELGENSIAVRGEGETPTLRTFGPNKLAAFTVANSALERGAEVLTGNSPASILIGSATLMDASHVDITRLRALFHAAGELLDHYPSEALDPAHLPAMSVLCDEIVTTLVTGLGSRKLKPDHQARQLQTRSMARIERFLDDHSEKVTGLQQLCQGTDLPLRTVETIVRSRTGMSALVYLRHRRMEHVRRALQARDANTSVTAVAMRFGFWHLGRFSKYYHEIYGELPSATLRRPGDRYVSR